MIKIKSKHKIEEIFKSLNLKCKIIAISPQIYVTDSDDNSVLYVKQKFLKLKEHVELFTDKTKEKKLCDIKTSSIIDLFVSRIFLCRGRGESQR